MKDVFLFVIGLLTGAILAAFITPKSGTELRGDIYHHYENRLQDLNSKVEQLQTQLRKLKAREAELEAQLAEQSTEG